MVDTVENDATVETDESSVEAALGDSAAEADPVSAASASGSSAQKTTPELLDDTPEIPENQAKPMPAAPGRGTLSERQERRITAVNDLHIEKERLQLNYIYKRVPKPYYARWKTEGNELFALAVVLRRRYRENRKK